MNFIFKILISYEFQNKTIEHSRNYLFDVNKKKLNKKITEKKKLLFELTLDSYFIKIDQS